MTICPICKKGKLIDVDDIVSDLDSRLFINSGQRCTACGEEILDEKEGQKMINVAKKLGLWGPPLRLFRKLSRSARGTVLRIPTDIEHNLHLKGTEDVAISRVGDNKLLIEIER